MTKKPSGSPNVPPPTRSNDKPTTPTKQTTTTTTKGKPKPLLTDRIREMVDKENKGED